MSQAIVEVLVKKFPGGTVEDSKYIDGFAFFEGIEEVSRKSGALRHFHQTSTGFKFRTIGEESHESYSSATEFELSELGGLEFFDPLQHWFLKEANICLKLSSTSTGRFLTLITTKTEFDQYLREHVVTIDTVCRFDIADIKP